MSDIRLYFCSCCTVICRCCEWKRANGRCRRITAFVRLMMTWILPMRSAGALAPRTIGRPLQARRCCSRSYSPRSTKKLDQGRSVLKKMTIQVSAGVKTEKWKIGCPRSLRSSAATSHYSSSGRQRPSYCRRKRTILSCWVDRPTRSQETSSISVQDRVPTAQDSRLPASCIEDNSKLASSPPARRVSCTAVAGKK